MVDAVLRNFTAIDDVLGGDAPKVEVIDTKMCLFPGTEGVYTDCCTDSSLKVCTYIMVMFFACFIIYAGIFIYIMNKKQWIKEQGLYVNVFGF